MKNILIIGVGSIGALMGAALIKAGLKITFAGKPNSSYTQTLKKEGLHLSYANGESLWISALHPQVRFVDTATDLKQKFDIIIIALKSNYLTEVISYIHAHSTPETILIHAQNGIPYWWFNCDRYLTSLSKNIFDDLGSSRHLNTVDPNGILYQNLNKFMSIGCVVKAPCQRTLEGKIKVRKIPQLILGSTKKNSNAQQQEIIKYLCNLFSQSGIKASYTDDIRIAVCNKLAINLTTNVFSALTGKVIAELTANSSINSLIKTVIAEMRHIFSCYGIPLADLPTEAKIYAYIKAPGSQSHLPSLAQDFAQHKLGEVSLITAPVEMAEIANLETPTLKSLSRLLQLAQTYSLKSKGSSHILTLDSDSGHCSLTKEVRESIIVKKHQMPNLLNQLLQVNSLALSQ
jgi:2-dehydropantoate 2-reductase